MSERYLITIAPLGSKLLKAYVHPLATIRKLKEKLASLYKTPEDKFFLVCDNKVLQQYHLIKSVITNSHVCHMMPKTVLPDVKDHPPKEKLTTLKMSNKADETPLKFNFADKNYKLDSTVFKNQVTSSSAPRPIAPKKNNMSPPVPHPGSLDKDSVNQKLNSIISNLSQSNSYRFEIPNHPLCAPPVVPISDSRVLLQSLPPLTINMITIPIHRSFLPDGSINSKAAMAPEFLSPQNLTSSVSSDSLRPKP